MNRVDPIPKLSIAGFEFFSHPTRLRFPFRYGIASMIEVPQQFVRAHIVVDGKPAEGLAAEGLPPKWFTKNPETPFQTDLMEMQQVIRHATDAAAGIARNPVTFFEFWQELTSAQAAWAQTSNVPPLLANLGVSLCERALLDALCRSLAKPLHNVVRTNALGIHLHEIYPQLGHVSPADLLPEAPLPSVQVRHTVGLADPLTPADISESERVNDGLPQDLESSIRAYGLCYFKVKLSGVATRDVERLRAFTGLCDRVCTGRWFVTLDGNENFPDFGTFRDFWETLVADRLLDTLHENLLVVEQPVHRDCALQEEAGELLHAWKDRPPLIIDESDGALGDVPRALSLGYSGTSHKNCKGIVKGIANACLLAKCRSQGQRTVLTGEDLCNLGPVPLLQDLAMMALLGIPHVERNGHHYYRGLSMWPDSWQSAVLQAHPDLYLRHPQGFARLGIAAGELNLASVNSAPFGCSPLLTFEARR